ncbi:hypothetical protein LWM68_15085 [Niabella sp. W65]|nr:hypothetical protein [Niabella sp. W65]MCH7363966.1 hypothetical protein [Niabella sp. W65]
MQITDPTIIDYEAVVAVERLQFLGKNGWFGYGVGNRRFFNLVVFINIGKRSPITTCLFPWGEAFPLAMLLEAGGVESSCTGPSNRSA